MFFILDSFCLSNIHVTLNIQNRDMHQTFIDNKLYNYFKTLVYTQFYHFISFFSIAALEHHDRGHLQKEGFVWAYGSGGMGVLHGK